MAIRTELGLTLPNRVGALGQVCDALAAGRITLVALSQETGGTLRVIVDNPPRAAAILREQHHQVNERDVLYATVPNEPGALSRTVRLVADAGINVEYAYATGVETQPMASVVIGVADAQAASAASGI